MKYQIVTLNDDSKLEFTPGINQTISSFCQLKKNEEHTKCPSFYQQLFLDYKSEVREFTKCPYGLYCVGPIKWTEQPRIVSGFIIEGDDCPSELSGDVEISTKAQVLEYLADFDKIARELYDQSYGNLEAAIHDVRHLNANITSHAERLLKILGYTENADWDKANLNSQETDKKTLSIYCASRDISAALSMYEIAIDPRRASDDVVPTNIHKSFYRQKQINLEKLDKKRLNVQIENTSVSKNLTQSFSLVPIILLNNAIKYAEINSAIYIKFVDTGNTFKIICTNTGPIVRKDELKVVFLKNQRGSNRSGVSGHGIGLWLASLILHANLGTIEMETDETGRDLAGRKIGKTTITVRLL